MTPVLSVILCTYNQAGYLWKALQSLFEQTLPKGAYEVLVIDNGSTDATRETVEAFRYMENLKYLFDPVLGLSHARNTGWQKARGKYAVYLDDDAVANPDWLARILHRFETLVPQPGSVGGKVTPIWEVERPQWLTREIEHHLSLVDWKDSPMFLDEDRFYLAGTNVSYRRGILQESGGFPTNLGRRGSLLRSNEELWMQRFLRSRGDAIWYDPEILVQHHIKAQRLTPSWFFERFFWQGVSDAILEAQIARWDGKRSPCLSQIRKDLLQVVRDSIQALRGFLSGSEEVVLRCRFHQNLGRLISNLRITFGRLEISVESAPSGLSSRLGHFSRLKER
jgi:glycosyltransferase involved in cell wall biosynthesis